MELSYISGSKFPGSKNEKKTFLKSFLYFREWNVLAPSLKNVLYFRKELTGPENQTKNLPQRNFLPLVTVS